MTEEQNHSFDELLRATLKEYMEEQVCPGLDQRILASLPARRSRLRWWIWTPFAFATASAAVFLVHSRYTPRRNPPAASVTAAAAHRAVPLAHGSGLEGPQVARDFSLGSPSDEPSQGTPALADGETAAVADLNRGASTTNDFVRELRSGAQHQQSGRSFGVATGSVPVKDAAGKTVRFSAWIKTEKVANGYAGLWWRVDGPGQGNNRPQLAFDNSMSRYINGQPAPGNGRIRGATGTTPWTLYQFELPIDETASNINFGAILTGTGTAWFDLMKVELDGVEYYDPNLDFDFESPTPKGFYAGCGGSAGCTDYKVGIDDTVSYYGHRSLKMQFVGDKTTKSSACTWPTMNPTPVNLDFSQGNIGSAPAAWLLGANAPGYEDLIVGANQCDGSSQCATVHSLRNNPSAALAFLYQDLDASSYRGKTLVYRAFVRIDPRLGGVGRLLVRVHRKDCSTAFRDDMGDHPITSGGWASYEIQAPIAKDAYHIEFGVQLVGNGAVWIDHSSMEFKPALGN